MSHQSPPTRPLRRWVLPLLILSLAINLLIVGIIAGWMLSPGGPRGDARTSGSVRGLVGEPFVRALPSEDRRALLRSAIKNRDRLQENRETLSRRLAAFLEALEAEDFSSETVAALLEEQRRVAIGRQEIGEALLIERLSAMTREGRVAYAARLRERLKHLRPPSRSD